MNRSKQWTEPRIDSFLQALDARESTGVVYTREPASWTRLSGADRFWRQGLMWSIPIYWKAMFDPSIVILFKDASNIRYPVRRYDVQEFHVQEKGAA